MPHTSTPLTLASAALSLALGPLLVSSPALAAEPEAVSAPPAAPAAEAPAAPAAPAPVETARARAEERRAAMDAEREKRYQELRASAAEFGVELPQTPPWKEARSAMPSPPETAPRPGQAPEELQARRQQQEAMRQARWERIREDATAHGIEMPSAPPWEEAEKRRQEMAERFQAYRKTIEQMTDEQREAARAVFGHPRAMPQDRAPQTGHYGHRGWEHPCQGDAYGSPYPPVIPYQYGAPGYDQGPPPPEQSGQ